MSDALHALDEKLQKEALRLSRGTGTRRTLKQGEYTPADIERIAWEATATINALVDELHFRGLRRRDNTNATKKKAGRTSGRRSTASTRTAPGPQDADGSGRQGE